jgi:hypothetical protein
VVGVLPWIHSMRIRLCSLQTCLVCICFRHMYVVNVVNTWSSRSCEHVFFNLFNAYIQVYIHNIYFCVCVYIYIMYFIIIK